MQTEYQSMTWSRIENIKKTSDTASSNVYFLSLPKIILGAISINKCPAQPLIPIYLIVGGILDLLPMLSTRICKGRSFYDFLNAVAFGWYIAGCVWVFQIYKPDFDSPSKSSYCEPWLYWITFCYQLFIMASIVMMLIIAFFFVMIMIIVTAFFVAQPNEF